MRYPELFKFGFDAEMAESDSPRRTNRWLRPLVAGGMLAGGAYLGDRYMNGGRGMDSLKHLFTSQPKPPPTQHPGYVDSVNQQVHDQVGSAYQRSRDSGLAETFSSPSNTATLPATAAAIPRIVGMMGGASAAQPLANGVGPTGGRTALALAGSKLLNNPVTSTALRALGPLGGMMNGGTDAVAEYGLGGGLFGGQPAQPGSTSYNVNRGVGLAAGALSGLHPAGMIGHGLIGAANGLNNIRQAARDGVDSLAEQHTNVLMNLNRAAINGDRQAIPTISAYLNQPHVKDFLQNNRQMVRYPHTAQLAETMARRSQAW